MRDVDIVGFLEEPPVFASLMVLIVVVFTILALMFW